MHAFLHGSLEFGASVRMHLQRLFVAWCFRSHAFLKSSPWLENSVYMRFIELPMAQYKKLYLSLMWNFSSCAPYVLFRQVGSSPEAHDAFQVVESTLVLRCALVCPVLCVQQRPLCYTPPCLWCACAGVVHVTPKCAMLHLSPTAGKCNFARFGVTCMCGHNNSILQSECALDFGECELFAVVKNCCPASAASPFRDEDSLSEVLDLTV